MVNFSPRNIHSKSYPPNSLHNYLPHPSGRNESIQNAVFNHHRFAFYYWNLWKLEYEKKYKSVNFDLISFDWHQDLAYPQDSEKEELINLDLNNEFEISYFSSYRLNSLNDTHILSAAYLDLINDIWVLCRQGKFDKDWEDEYITDYSGKEHTIRKFRTEEELKVALFQSNIDNLFFDIDLDYFTINNNIAPEDKFIYMKDKDVKNLLSYDNDLIKWIFERVEGITIALEPEYTGGISKSLKYFTLIEKLWFNGSIENWYTEWNHLISNRK